MAFFAKCCEPAPFWLPHKVWWKWPQVKKPRQAIVVLWFRPHHPKLTNRLVSYIDFYNVRDTDLSFERYFKELKNRSNSCGQRPILFFFYFQMKVRRKIDLMKSVIFRAFARERQGCHLAFLKLFARNKMVWPFFGLFECWRKK